MTSLLGKKRKISYFYIWKLEALGYAKFNDEKNPNSSLLTVVYLQLLSNTCFYDDLMKAEICSSWKPEVYRNL